MKTSESTFTGKKRKSEEIWKISKWKFRYLNCCSLWSHLRLKVDFLRWKFPFQWRWTVSPSTVATTKLLLGYSLRNVNKTMSGRPQLLIWSRLGYLDIEKPCNGRICPKLCSPEWTRRWLWSAEWIRRLSWWFRRHIGRCIERRCSGSAMRRWWSMLRKSRFRCESILFGCGSLFWSVS